MSRKGITTGTCAAAAAKAAVLAALGQPVEGVEICLPAGEKKAVSVYPIETGGYATEGLNWDFAEIWAVRKYSGDDPDITNGMEIRATVRLKPEGTVELLGGEGVGRVTLPGLACPVGEAAINPVPRNMILEAAAEGFEACGYEGGAEITISIPDGEEVAKKTYNPRLGVVGGLSILGTSGIVEPMSSQALIDTISVEMNVRRAAGAEYLILTPGNYGEEFLRKFYGKAAGELYFVKISNFVGESLDLAKAKGFKGILLVAHMGKLVKVAAGIMNTHSSWGDARMETLAAHGALHGGSRELIGRIMTSVTTDRAWEAILEWDEPGSRQDNPECRQDNPQCRLAEKMTASLMEKVKFHLEARVHGEMTVHSVMFSNQHGLLGATEGFEEERHLFL